MCPECEKCAGDRRERKKIIFRKCGENFCCMMHVMDGQNEFAIMLEVLRSIIFGRENKAAEIALQMDFNVHI